MPPKKKYDERLTIPITSAMLANLDQIAVKQRRSRNDLVRRALRDFIDHQGEVAGSRRWFVGTFRDATDELLRILSWQLTLLTILAAEGFSIIIRQLTGAEEHTAGWLLERVEEMTVSQGWKVYHRLITTINAAHDVGVEAYDDQMDDGA